MLSPIEFWCGVIALCVVGIVFLVREERSAEARAEAPIKIGERSRRPRELQADWWASHEFLLAVTSIGLYALLLWLMINR